MDELGLALVFMIVGAFLGSIISPASEMFFANFFSRSGDRYSIANGLTLLSAANASWVVSFLLFETTKHSASATAAVLVLYLIAAVLLVASYSQFRKSGGGAIQNRLIRVVVLLVFGNLAWLLGESAEVALRVVGFDSFPHLTVKYVFFVIAASCFLAGGLTSFRQNKHDAQQGRPTDADKQRG